MKKVLCACVLTSMFAVSAASASEFTINPMIGAAHSKATGTNLAVGLEGEYSDFIFGYTYTGDKNKGNGTYSNIDGGFDGSPDFDATYSTNDKYKAHSLYGGYQFGLGAGNLAFKAGIEMSKYSVGGRFDAVEMDKTGNTAGAAYEGKSNNVISPMVGVGYYMDNGLNFNLHYTFQSGSRDMTYNGSIYVNKNKASHSETFKKDISNKDFGTVMFTVGYRF